MIASNERYFLFYSHVGDLRVSTGTESSSEELVSIVPAFPAHLSWVFIAVSYRKNKTKQNKIITYFKGATPFSRKVNRHKQIHNSFTF